MYWPADTQLVSNVAREAKRVAHPCTRGWDSKSFKVSYSFVYQSWHDKFVFYKEDSGF